MPMKTKSVRCCLTERQLIEQYESYKFDNELTDREIISMALAQFLNEREENEQCS